MLKVWGGDWFPSTYLLVLQSPTVILDRSTLNNPTIYELQSMIYDPPFLLLYHRFYGKAYRQSVLPLLLTATKSCIPLFCKQSQAPSIAVWLKKVKVIMSWRPWKEALGKILKRNGSTGTNFFTLRITRHCWVESSKLEAAPLGLSWSGQEGGMSGSLSSLPCSLTSRLPFLFF